MELLNDEQFIEKVFDYKNEEEWKFKGNKPAIIDFFAEWCGPCKTLTPILEEISKEFEGKIDVYKVDVDECSELSAAFQIQSIPTTLFIPMGETPEIALGVIPKESILSVIDELFKLKIDGDESTD